MRKLVAFSVVSACTLLLLYACTPEESDEPIAPAAFALPDEPNDSDGYSPIKRYEPMNVPADNPVTLAKAELGRQLYYDYRLSGDGSRSCYHCHVVEHGQLQCL